MRQVAEEKADAAVPSSWGGGQRVHRILECRGSGARSVDVRV